ncbi:type II secretion system F family protein [Marinactinospora thermotolerans]|uniref:type II secretion system F family protein n=1 Tax=Marinactinospora thermotolerans TaxID=531310 RepID=UPI003D93E79B
MPVLPFSPESLLVLGTAGWTVLCALPSPSAVRLRRIIGNAPLPPGSFWQRPHGWANAVLDRDRARRRRAAIDLCRATAAELRGGRGPSDALASAVDELDASVAADLGRVVAALRGGDDPVPALSRVAELPGFAGMRHVASCWRVAYDTGAGLADVMDRLADSLARDEAHLRELSAHLAGPRTTALLLSLLPVAGLLLAAALGTGPLRFLCTTPAGLVCLGGGLGLDVLGLYWVRRMSRGVTAWIESR